MKGLEMAKRRKNNYIKKIAIEKPHNIYIQKYINLIYIRLFPTKGKNLLPKKNILTDRSIDRLKESEKRIKQLQIFL